MCSGVKSLALALALKLKSLLTTLLLSKSGQQRNSFCTAYDAHWALLSMVSQRMSASMCDCLADTDVRCL